jgi:subtilisin family serine protease
MVNRPLGVVLLVVAAPGIVEAGPIRKHPRPIPGSYIVVLREDAARSPKDAFSRTPSVAEVATDMVDLSHLGRRRHVYEHALRGFAVEATAFEAEQLANDSRVAFVEEDGVMEASAVQTSATWGLDRVDQRTLPLNTAYQYDETGSGVHAYVIDSGIRATHSQFKGRVGNGFSAVSDGQGTNDCNGHGTHVAGTIGGTTFGIAKAVTLHPVRVLGCSGTGTSSGVIAGIEWVTANRVRPAVANMSLGGGISSALDLAVVNSIAAGVTYAVAAGNANTDACQNSPARVAAALTVGAVGSTDIRTSFSNFGACLDLFAPGSAIASAWHTSDTATNTLSGTSMAAPHVAGAAALYLQTNRSALPAQVVQAVLGLATTGRVGSAGTGSPNRLLYTLFPAGVTADVTLPLVQLTQPLNGSTVSASVSLVANASDNSGIVSAVEFFVDGVMKGTDTAAPFAIGWDTRTASEGLHVLTAKAYDPSHNVGSSGQVAVTVRNQTSTVSAERVVNGGFESATTGWGLAGNAYYVNGGGAHSGLGYMALALYDSANGYLYQNVAIPSTATGSLTFWLNVTSGESTASGARDRLFVEIRSTSGTLLATLATYSNLQKTTGATYTLCSLNVAAYRGQNVRVQFRATNDAALATAFRVDDVSLR